MFAKCRLAYAASTSPLPQFKRCIRMNEFFASVRAQIGPLKQSQVDGFNALLTATIGLRTEWRAYILATAWHETAFTMQPIIERGGKSYFNQYDPKHNPKKAKALGNTLPGDGYKYRGRGYVQITGRANYDKASRACSVDMVANPELALKPDLAAKIIVRGMTEGWFTGREMADYDNYQDMRRVVNGTDKAKDIAGYAAKFEKALRAQENAAQPVSPVPAPAVPETPENPPVAQSAAPRGLLKAFLALIFAMFSTKKG